MDDQRAPPMPPVLAAGAGRDVLSYRTLKVLADLDPAVVEVRGYTRYRIEGDMISIIDRGGISRDLPSRVEQGAEPAQTRPTPTVPQQFVAEIGVGGVDAHVER